MLCQKLNSERCLLRVCSGTQTKLLSQALLMHGSETNNIDHVILYVRGV